MMQHISRILSSIFTPLLTPTYGMFLAMWTSILCYRSLSARILVLLGIFLITCVIPLVFISVLYRFKLVGDRELYNRKDRYFPYVAAILSYAAATYYIMYVHAPVWLVAFMAGGTLTVIITMIVNFWWKISAHSAGFGGVIAMLLFMQTEGVQAFNLIWLTCAVILLAGLVGTARLYLERHTFWQVALGFLNGYFCVKATLALFT